MSSYEDQCVKIGGVFHTLYFENEVGDPPPQIFCISDIGNSLSDCGQLQTVKKSVLWKFFARTFLRELCPRFSFDSLLPSLILSIFTKKKILNLHHFNESLCYFHSYAIEFFYKCMHDLKVSFCEVKSTLRNDINCKLL